MGKPVGHDELRELFQIPMRGNEMRAVRATTSA